MDTKSYLKEAFKLFLLFLIGGLVYSAIEIAYKGDSHYSMFLVGGLCFILLGGINNYLNYDMPVIYQMLASSFIITTLEFISGCIVNLWLKLGVWDYSRLPMNFLGQVCLLFMIIWFFLSLPGIMLDDFIRWKMFGEEKPHYIFFPAPRRRKSKAVPENIQIAAIVPAEAEKAG